MERAVVAPGPIADQRRTSIDLSAKHPTILVAQLRYSHRHEPFVPVQSRSPAHLTATRLAHVNVRSKRLDPALQSAHDALAADRKSDIAAVLSALLEAAERAVTTLERSAVSPPPHPPVQMPGG